MDRRPWGMVQGNKGYTVTYTKQQDVTSDTENKIKTITDYVVLNRASYDKAISPYDVLGEGAEFGVVADKYIQTMHTETNFAVHSFENTADAPLEVDASGDFPIPFYYE